MSSHKQWVPIVAILAILGFASLVFVLSLSDPQTPTDGQNLTGLSPEPVAKETPRDEKAGLTTRLETREPIHVDGQPLEEGSALDYRNRVHGSVISATNEERLADATVQLREAQSLAAAINFGQGATPQSQVMTVATDREGRFQFFNVATNKNYEICVSAKDHALGTLSLATIPSIGDSEDYVIRLEEGFVIEGRVLDKVTQSPIAGARLIARRSNPMAMWLAASSSELEPGDKVAESDGSGYFEIKNAPSGGVDVIVQAEDYAEVRKTLQLDELALTNKRKEEDFQLSPGGVISGRVESVEGTLIADARITAMSTVKNQTSSVTTSSDKDGKFVLKGLQEGEVYILRALQPGYLHEGTNRHKVGESEVVVKMSTTGKVAGRVINARTGRPLRSFTATVVQFRKNQLLNQQAAVPGQPVAESQGAGPGLGTIDTSAAENERQKVISMGGFNAQPVIYSALRHTEKNFQSPDGSFELPGITVSGEYVVRIEASGLAPQLSQPFQCNKGVSANVGDIYLSNGGAIEGTVVDSAGAPVHGARVHINCGGADPSQNPLIKFLGPIGPQPLQRKSTTTDGDGRFRVDMLIPAEGVNVLVQKTGYSDANSEQVAIAADKTTTVTPIVMKRGGVVYGVVLQDGVAPKAGMKVMLRPIASAGNATFFNREMVTGKPGKFRFDGIPEGKYRIHAVDANPGANPFAHIIRMKQTEQTIEVYDGQEVQVSLSVPTETTPIAPMRPSYDTPPRPRQPVVPKNQKPVRKPSEVSPDEVTNDGADAKRDADTGDDEKEG